jgi:hypothetical protein
MVLVCRILSLVYVAIALASCGSWRQKLDREKINEAVDFVADNTDISILNQKYGTPFAEINLYELDDLAKKGSWFRIYPPSDRSIKTSSKYQKVRIFTNIDYVHCFILDKNNKISDVIIYRN